MPVRAAIARAAQATGVDFDFLLAQAKIESSLDPSARAPTSSAAGLYQFTAGTWLATLDRHGAQHGLGWADAAIEAGRIADPASRAQVMALRFDPDASALMAAELARDNRADLADALGRDPDHAELYLAHFLGSAGAGTFLRALSNDPSQSAAALMPAAARANRAIFFDGAAPRSVAGVMDLVRAKVTAAKEGGGRAWVEAIPSSVPGEGSGGWGLPAGASVAGTLHRGPSAPGPGPGFPEHPPMSATLRDSFGLAANNAQAAPGYVREAYARLQRFGL